MGSKKNSPYNDPQFQVVTPTHDSVPGPVEVLLHNWVGSGQNMSLDMTNLPSIPAPTDFPTVRGTIKAGIPGTYDVSMSMAKTQQDEDGIFGARYSLGDLTFNLNGYVTINSNGTYSFSGEINTEITQLLPVAKVDSRFREVLARYRFWPLSCNPAGLVGLKIGFGGLGSPYYIKAEFIPLDEVACKDFKVAIASALEAKALDAYMLNYDEFVAANFFESTTLELDVEFQRAPDSQRRAARETLAMLKQLRRTIDCEAGYIEFK